MEPRRLTVSEIIDQFDWEVEPLTQARLREVLDLDTKTGNFVGKTGKRAGKIAGYIRHQNGHPVVAIKIDGVAYLAHRLVFLWTYGRWPTGWLDHINRNSLDNRLSNLDEVVGRDGWSLNKFNGNLYQNNSSGHSGVRFFADGQRRRRWRAWIGNNEHLGSFSTYEEAVAARQAAEIKKFGCLQKDLCKPENRQPKPKPSFWRRF
jgi:hypothetical protein